MSDFKIDSNVETDLALNIEENDLPFKKRTCDTEVVCSKKMKGMNTGEMPEAISEKSNFFDVLEQLKFTNTPSLKHRKDIASKAAAEINTEFGETIIQVYQKQYKKMREQITEGRCIAEKKPKLDGKPIGNVGDAYRMCVKSLSVSQLIYMVLNG